MSLFKISSALRRALVENSSADKVSFLKDGTVKFYRGYFYSNGGSAEKWTERVTTFLTSGKIAFEVVDSGDVWKPFKGGASVDRQTHWYCTVRILGWNDDVVRCS